MDTLKRLCLTVIFMLLAPTVPAGQLTILTENSPPGNFIDDGGELTGLSVDIVREIMKRLDLEAKITVLPWARAYRMLQKEADVMLFSTTRTPQREKLFKWAGPLIKQEWVFLARKDSNLSIASLDDARDVTLIGTYNEDARGQYLEAKGFTNLHSANNMSQLIRMLRKKRVDLIAISRLNHKKCYGKQKDHMDRFRIVHTFKKIELYMAFSQETSDSIVQKWQQTYDDLAQEGVLDAVNKKWLKGSSKNPPDWH